MKRFERHHAGWPRRGIAWSALLVLALWLTGLVLETWAADLVPQLLPWQIQARRAALVIHGTGAWIFCLLAGRWAWPHVALVWRRAADGTWWLGLASALIAVVVAASGLLLLYGPGEANAGAAWTHWWAALGWPAVLLLHVRRLLRRRPA